jgi:hypothetical protein
MKNRREHFPAVEFLASQPRADLGVVRLCDETAVVSPKLLEFEDDFLERGRHGNQCPVFRDQFFGCEEIITDEKAMESSLISPEIG